MSSELNPTTANADRYAALLNEAASIRGLSLWRDAWMRLRKNYAAMASLVALCTIGLLAFFTPLLPLQSPRLIHLTKTDQYQPPRFSAAPLGITKAQLAQFNQDLRELQTQRAKATGETRDALDVELAGKLETHPFYEYWHNPGPLTFWLLEVRMALFGEWCIPSICGTDELGRDVLSRIFWGARVSLMVGILAALVSLVIGVSYGAIAGYAGGFIDSTMMRIVDVLYSIPFIFIVINLIMVIRDDRLKAALLNWGITEITLFYIVIGALFWLTMSRVVRGQVISLKHEQFVDAARTIGAGSGRIVFRHIVPNVLGIVIVYLTLTIPSVMLFEAFLSFLGFGIQPPDVSWGLLVNDGIKVITPIGIHWWLVLFPSLALAITLFALNFLGDGLRDALDPRMKNR
jgi:oligopeptide transport system permease protein